MNEDINYLIDNADFDKKPLLNYITNLQEELKETNESLTWWTNRFNAVERDNKELKQENQKLVKVIDELEEYILNHYIVGHTIQNASLDDILNKLTELKGGSDDVEN